MEELPLLFPQFGTGTCINCGFLTYRRAWANAASHDEATASMRADAHFPGGWPYCFVHATSIAQEMADLEANGVPGEQRLKTVLEKGRDCPEWYPWREGFSPKEHAEERQRERLEQRREEFERRMEEERRRFETQLANRAEQAEQRRYNLGLLIAVAAGALAFAEVIMAILGAGPGSILGDLLGLK